MWLVDSYRKTNKIVLWYKDAYSNKRVEVPYTTYIYADLSARSILDKLSLEYKMVKRYDYHGVLLDVLKIRVPRLDRYERFVRMLEMAFGYKIKLYSADIIPEQGFCYEHRLTPCGHVDGLDEQPPLTQVKIELSTHDGYVNTNKPITSIRINDKIISGCEREVLQQFLDEFNKIDPDVIISPYAYARIPYLSERLTHHGLSVPFHRWDATPIRYRGGRSFWSYGQVQYRDYTIRLKGRLLVDTTTQVGGYCELDAIVELAQLTGTLFQNVSSRAFGASFQHALVKHMVQEDLLVPHKEKPVDTPFSMLELLKADRYGHTFDAKVGFHTNVAEFDFSSMYPWIIFNHNVSADTILTDVGPFEQVPGIRVKISRRKKGLVPQAIKPLIDRRMMYKANPTSVNRKRAVGLKWILVTSYGYLRFREFKLGIASAHMSIGAYARETLLSASLLAEEFGYEVKHGIIDSLYLHKKVISKVDTDEFSAAVLKKIKIPMSFEGLFKWIIFLPSVNNDQKPVPARYFGALVNGSIKARGIEVRQRSAPVIVKRFQQEALDMMGECSTKKEIIGLVPRLGRLLKEYVQGLPFSSASDLACKIRVGKEYYTHNIPQKIITQKLKSQGVSVRPGMMISFLYSARGVVLPSEFDGVVDAQEYRKRLIKSLFVLLQVFGVKKKECEAMSLVDRQSKLEEFTYLPIIVSPSVHK